jgi:predicted O-methyltransferase YrrM
MGIEKPYTQLTPGEIALIKKYASNRHRGVEIGVLEGFTTAEIAKSMDTGGVLFAIDPFFKGRLGFSYGEVITNRYLRKEKVFHKVRLIKKKSSDAVCDINCGIDFCFIDGEHTLEALEKDWSDWSAKLVPQGFIGLHDTAFVSTGDYNNFELISYFEEIIKFDNRFELVERIGSLNILKKVKS